MVSHGQNVGKVRFHTKKWATQDRGGPVRGSPSRATNQEVAPNPAAARLWQEYLYSDEGQNLWLKGGARPVRFEAMKTAGTLDAAAAAALPPIEGAAVVPTQADAEAGKAYLAENWANAVG